MAIRGVVFDFGGVISAAQATDFFPTMKRLTGWDEATIRAGWKRHRLLMDADQIPVEEVYVRIAKDLGETLPEAVVAQVRKLDYDSWAVPNLETLAWAKTLKAQGYKIGILTNMPSDFEPWFDAAGKAFRALADAELISGHVHLVKPDPAIYRLMEARMGLPPEELFFLDDTPANVEAARQCGWAAHVYTTAAEAQKALDALG